MEEIMNKTRRRRVLAAVFTAVFASTTMLGSGAFASDGSQTGDSPSPTVMVQTADSVVTPASVDGCAKKAITGGYKYTNCKIFTWVGSWSMSFYADFTIKSGSAADSINSVRNWAWSWGGSVTQTSHNLSIGQATENSNGPAWARYTGVFTGPLIGTKTEWVSLWVGGNSYGEKHSGG